LKLVWKMKTLIVLFAFVAATMAKECGTLAALKVKSEWGRAYSSGHDREAFAQAIWRATFAQAPDARDLFKRVHGDDTNHPAFIAHAERVLGGLDIAINTLDQQETLKAELDHLQKQHEGRKIPDSYFDAFKTAILHVVAAQLGRCWDRTAWDACIEHIEDGIKGHH
jgi:hemoglobin-like flavoprotein